MIYYYQENGETYQIEADSYQRRQATGASNDESGWFYTASWDSGLTETLKYSDGLPTDTFVIDGRCGSNDRGIRFYVNGAANCAQNGSTPRRRLEALNFSYVQPAACLTDFYKNGAVIKTIDNCLAVGDDPRNEGCSACCRELLPIVRSLRV